jgi:hypothetical protein
MGTQLNASGVRVDWALVDSILDDVSERFADVGAELRGEGWTDEQVEEFRSAVSSAIQSVLK